MTDESTDDAAARAAFEAHVFELGWPAHVLKRDENGEYAHLDTFDDFDAFRDGWRAAKAQQSTPSTDDTK